MRNNDLNLFDKFGRKRVKYVARSLVMREWKTDILPLFLQLFAAYSSLCRQDDVSYYR